MSTLRRDFNALAQKISAPMCFHVKYGAWLPWLQVFCVTGSRWDDIWSHMMACEVIGKTPENAYRNYDWSKFQVSKVSDLQMHMPKWHLATPLGLRQAAAKNLTLGNSFSLSRCLCNRKFGVAHLLTATHFFHHLEGVLWVAVTTHTLTYTFTCQTQSFHDFSNRGSLGWTQCQHLVTWILNQLLQNAAG